MEFFIDSEFRDKLPALTPEQFNQLRDNILADGYVKHPLVIWHGSLEKEDADGNVDHTERDYLIDGHNRWRIIQEHPELPYEVSHREFPNKWAAIAWIYKNQIGQRNLSDLWQMKVNAEIVKAELKAVGEHTGNQYTSKMELDTSDPIPKDNKPTSTVERVSQEIGVPAGTLKKQLETIRGLDAADKVDPGFQADYLNGEIQATKKDVRSLRLIEDEGELAVATEKLRAGERLDADTIKSLRDYKEPLVQRVSTLDGQPDKFGEEFSDVLEDLNLTADTFLRQFEKTLRENRKLVKGNLAEVVSVMERVKKSLEKMERRF